MNRSARVVIASAALIMLAAFYFMVPNADQRTYPPPGVSDWVYEKTLSVIECPEPSGLVLREDMGSFLIVDDGARDRPGGVYEYDLSGKLIRSSQIGGDLEGITYHPGRKSYFVVNEKKDAVLELSAADLKLVAEYRLPERFREKPLLRPGGNGLEGITFQPEPDAPGGGYLWLVNQDDPPLLIKTTLPGEGTTLTVHATLLMPGLNLGGLFYDPQRKLIWVSHAWQNLVSLVDPETLRVVDWQVLPGYAQEGISLDRQGRLWIASDLGGVSIYRPRPSRRGEDQ